MPWIEPPQHRPRLNGREKACMFDWLIAPSIAVLLLINVLDSLDLLGLRRCAGQSARRRRDADGPAGDGPDAARPGAQRG